MHRNKTHGPELVLATLFVLVLLPLITMPQYALYAVWFFPIPVILFTLCDMKWIPAGISIVAGICLLYSGIGWTSVLFAFGLYVLGQFLSDPLRRRKNPYPALLASTLVIIMLEMVLLAQFEWHGFHLYQQLSNQLAQESASNYPFLQMNSEAWQKAVEQTLEWLRLMLPGFLCIIAFILASANFLAARFLATSVSEKPFLLLPWKLPYSVVMIYILTLTCVLFGWLSSYPFWWHAVNSAMLLAGFLIGIQGLAFVWRRLYGKKGARIWMGLLFALSLLPIIRSVYILLGLLDSSNRARNT